MIGGLVKVGASAGRRTVATGLRPARGAWAMTWRVERKVRDRLVRQGGQLTVACVDAALTSPYADEVIEHVVDSALAERAVAQALRGRLVDVVAVELEPMLERAFVRPGTERLVEQAGARLAEDVVERLRGSSALAALVEDIARSPAIVDALAQDTGLVSSPDAA